MEIIEHLNKQIDTMLSDYKNLQYENDRLKLIINNLKNKNDELEKSNQDMLLSIDRTLTFSGVESGNNSDISHK